VKERVWQSIACAAMLSITVAAAGAEATSSVPLLPSPLAFPARIGPMRYTGSPHKYDDPRLGLSYQYGGDGLSLTVYVYDAGEKDLVDGAETSSTCREFEIAKAGIMQAYQNPKLKIEQRVRLNPPAEFPQMREAQYEFEREGMPLISFIWITTAAKHFVKLRLSMNPRLRDELPEARRAVLAVVGDAIKPHLTAAKPKDKEEKDSDRSMAFSLDSLMGGGDDAFEASFLYLMLLNEVAEKSADLAAVCGGEFVPSLQTELGIYRGMFAPDQDLAKSKVGKVITKIDKAGFLEEYLWTDRHRDPWGTTPPEGLTLSEFETWRQKNLKRFNLPEFGTVTIDHPRVLPLEPLSP